MIKHAYSVSFLLSINIFVWQNVLYFLDAPRKYTRTQPNLELIIMLIRTTHISANLMKTLVIIG